MLAQDPGELFDVVTESGEPTGVIKPRALVHRDGDWHRAVHVWVYGINADGPFVLLNQRGKHKDTWPLALDATVGGHLGAGESVEDAFREVEEEIGVRIDHERFEWILQRKRSSGDLIPGVLDQEIQEVFLVRDDRPLSAFLPNIAELEGLVQVQLADFAELASGDIDSVQGRVLYALSGEIGVHQLTAEQLLVRGNDPYFIEIAAEIGKRV